MPRPPVIKTVDWAAVLEAASGYEQWLADAESQENAAAMEQSRKSLELSAETKQRLSAMRRIVYVAAFAEDWCGDVVRHVPVLQKMADYSDKLVVKYLTRADRPDVFIRFLTNGGEAIPKFIFLSEDLIECGNWGPMPAAERRLIARGKACGRVGDARKLVAAAYASDEQRQKVVSELEEHIETASAEAP